MSDSPPPSDNPYSAPTADVEVSHTAMNRHFCDAQRLPAGDGLNFIGDAWTIFKKTPFVWVGMMLVYLVIMLTILIVPFLGAILSTLIAPVFMGGMMMAAQAADNGEAPSISHLFSAFDAHGGKLVLLGLTYLGLLMLTFGVAFIFALPFGLGQSAAGPLPVGISIIITFVGVFSAVMANVFAAPLIVFQSMAVITALRASFNGCIRNLFPLTIFTLIFLILGVIAMLPLGLGMLILMPVGAITFYVMYKRIFTLLS